MKILQFICPTDTLAQEVQRLMIDQFNTWSRLQRLAQDPGYVTQPFSTSQWRVHQTDPTLHWLDWDSVYANLGDDGRRVADQMLGTGPLQGNMLDDPVVPDMPETTFQIVDVADPVAEGYEAPAPFVGA